jgi:hypothetical protein
MAFHNSWCVVSPGLNIDICWHTEPIFRLALALSSDSTPSWGGDSSFWYWQQRFQKAIEFFSIIQPLRSV